MELPPQAPPTFTGTPISVLSETRHLINTLRQILNKVTVSDEPSFEVLVPLAHADNTRIMGTRALVFYYSVAVDANLREASGEAKKLLKDFSTEMAMNKNLYKLIDSVLKNNNSIGSESQRLLESFRRDCVRNGSNLHINSDQEIRFRAIQSRLNEITVEFQKNSIQSRLENVLWLSPEELEGVPDYILKRMERGEGKNKEKLQLIVNNWGDSVLYHAKSPEIRRRIELARGRCPENLPLFKEMVILRDDAARLLGYPNHAAFRMEEKVAKTPETVNKFLATLRSKLTENGQAVLKQLKTLKRQYCNSEANSEESADYFFFWDYNYYDHLWPVSRSTGGPKFSEYFPLQHTITIILETFQNLFSLRFVEILGVDRNRLSPSGNGNDIIWHQDVQIFSVWDAAEENSFLGYLYLDPFARDGKWEGNSCSNIVPGFTREDGSRQYPATALLCSFPRPNSKPCLLSHQQLLLLFHELGHGIHDLVSKTEYARFHGPGGTVEDFGEGPSQILENWCRIPAQLKAMSRHYSYLSPQYLEVWKQQADKTLQPPEQIPDNIIDAALATNWWDPLEYLNQVFWCTFDMTVHQPESHDAICNMDITETWNKLRRSICLFDDCSTLGFPYEACAYTTFGHLVEDYDAGYYSYFFSNVFAADIFDTLFKADPQNAKEILRYRRMFLEKGGSQDGMELVVNILGREPQMSSFYKQVGLE